VTIQLFRLTAPPEDEIRRFIRKPKDSAFSYPEVGASATAVPTGYDVDHNRIQLGSGEVTWRRAMDAIRAWSRLRGGIEGWHRKRRIAFGDWFAPPGRNLERRLESAGLESPVPHPDRRAALDNLTRKNDTGLKIMSDLTPGCSATDDINHELEANGCAGTK
jgi:hypothetical protein